MLAVTPQCLSTIICEGIHVHLGHQARIHLSKEEKLDHFHFSLSSKQMSWIEPQKKISYKCTRSSKFDISSVIGIQPLQVVVLIPFLIQCLGVLREWVIKGLFTDAMIAVLQDKGTNYLSLNLNQIAV